MAIVAARPTLHWWAGCQGSLGHKSDEFGAGVAQQVAGDVLVVLSEGRGRPEGYLSIGEVDRAAR